MLRCTCDAIGRWVLTVSKARRASVIRLTSVMAAVRVLVLILTLSTMKLLVLLVVSR